MHVVVMDPSETSEPKEEMMAKHRKLVWRVMRNLRKCIRDNYPSWVVPKVDWRIYYNVGMHPSCDRYC